MLGLGASERHLSCSSVIFRKGSSRFIRKMLSNNYAQNMKVRLLRVRSLEMLLHTRKSLTKVFKMSKSGSKVTVDVICSCNEAVNCTKPFGERMSLCICLSKILYNNLVLFAGVSTLEQQLMICGNFFFSDKKRKCSSLSPNSISRTCACFELKSFASGLYKWVTVRLQNTREYPNVIGRQSITNWRNLIPTAPSPPHTQHMHRQFHILCTILL